MNADSVLALQNDRVHEISQKINNEKDQRSADEEKALNEQWEQAITQRQQYYDSAEKQLKEKVPNYSREIWTESLIN